MKIFSRQQPAFEALTDGDYVFQNEIGGGRRVYLIGSNRQYWDQYLSRGIRYGYEVIRKGLPCHLYIDLDVNKVKWPNMKVIEIWQTLEKHIDFVFINQFDVPVDDIEKNIQFSSNSQKGSMHIIYKIKGKMFKNNAHVGAFMRCVHAFISAHDPDTSVIFEEKFVDMAMHGSK